MTGLEIGLAAGFGGFIVFTILTWIGACIDCERLSRRADIAERETKSAQATAKMWRRWLDDERRAWHELDQGVGRAICRIISAHSDRCAKGLERRRDPAHYYGREYDFRAAGIREALNILEEETGRYKEEKEDPGLGYARTLRRKMAEERVGAPGHGPVTAPCAVCGGHACTYRWGQCISTWSSETDITGTFTTTRWQDFDQRFEVGWVPVCARHANDLDGGDNVVVRREGYRRG